MRMRLYSCHHYIPAVYANNDLFTPMLTGPIEDPSSLPHGIDWDGQGDNISTQEPFSDLRQQYFAWKNRLDSLDYIGFEHYRRPFFIDVMSPEKINHIYPALYQIRRQLWNDLAEWRAAIDFRTHQMHTAMRQALTRSEKDEIRRWVGQSDIITVRPVNNESIDGQWLRHHSHAVWHDLIRVTKDLRSRAGCDYEVDTSIRSKYYLNMYIMKASLFDEYMTWLFAIITEMQKLYPNPERRLWGFVAERVFSFFVYSMRVRCPTLSITEIPHLYVEELYAP